MWFFLAYLDRVKRIWYLSPMRAAKVQARLRIRSFCWICDGVAQFYIEIDLSEKMTSN